jgi:hypothetical protein
MTQQLTKIGTVTLNEVRTHQNRFETACWYETVEAQPQTVDLFFTGSGVCAQFEGVITDAYFPSGFGGLYTYTDAQQERDAKKVGRADAIGLNIQLSSKDIVMALVGTCDGTIEVRDMTLNIEQWFLHLITYDCWQSNVENTRGGSAFPNDGTDKYDKAYMVMTPRIAGVRCDTSHCGFNRNGGVREMVELASQWIAAKQQIKAALVAA